jgi:hypothetical protein
MKLVISEKPLKLRGEGGGTVSFAAPFVFAGGVLFDVAPVEKRSFAMDRQGYAALTARINGS